MSNVVIGKDDELLLRLHQGEYDKKPDRLKGIECANAPCAVFVPEEGYYCRRFQTWAGLCSESHKVANEGEQTKHLGSASMLAAKE